MFYLMNGFDHDITSRVCNSSFVFHLVNVFGHDITSRVCNSSHIFDLMILLTHQQQVCSKSYNV